MKGLKKTIIPMAIFILLGTSCKKSECHDCHYDAADGSEIELGEYCDDDLESIEANGYNDNGTVRTVHCHGH